MRRSLRGLCSAIDLDGKPSAYYPRFRPRRLVMPVDPNNVHSDKRAKNQFIIRQGAQGRLRKQVERRGVLQLSSVPPERTVGDMFRFLLESCEQSRLFDARACFSGEPLKDLEALLQQAREFDERVAQKRVEREKEERNKSSSSSSSLLRKPESDASGGTANAMSVRAVDSMWALLDRTPLNAPVHGALAQRGKSIVERTIATTAYDAFPRLRSKHLQQLLHESCGLLPSSRVSLRLGFAQHAGVEGDIGMWRELNVLTQRVQTARRKAAAHLERMEKGVAQQRRWYWRSVLTSAAGRLKMFPAHTEDLQPRLEWVRSSLFAFVGFLEMAERSGESGIDVRTFVLKMYCSQLGQFAYRRQLLHEADRFSESYLHQQRDHQEEGDSEGDTASARRVLAEGMHEQLMRLRSRTADELEVLEGKTHPLNDRADQRRAQFESSGGTHAVQSLKDDLFDDYRAERHAALAPPMLIHSLDTQNALKEAQLILRYAADVPPALRDAPIDVDQVVRKTVEVHETNSYASLHYDQQYRQVEYTVCRLFCGAHCVGEGKGETLMEAMQEAALHMTTNYYLREPPTQVEAGAATTTTTASPSVTTARDGETDKGPAVRMRDRRVEEELAL